MQQVIPSLDVPYQIIGGRAFTFTTNLFSQTSGEVGMALLKNPSSSGVKIMVTHFNFGTDATSVRSIYRLYKNPTITGNGDSLSIVNTNFKSSNTSLIEAYKSPTLSSNGTLLNMKIFHANDGSGGLNRNYVLEPGDSLLVTVDHSIGNTAGFTDIYWLEGV